MRGLRRLFSREPWEDLLLACVKVLAIGGVAYMALRDDLLTLAGMLHVPPQELVRAAFAPLGSAALKILAAMAVAAGLELALSRRRFLTRLRMTREEARRELKEDEGDPLLRGQRKRRHRELARARAAVEVPRADALVVNPTHVAVALRYRSGESRAPRVTAKGKGKLAEIMRDLARAHGIPIVEDVALARLLHRKVKVGREVPATTYKAVAAILAYVYRVTGRRAA
jgi:flagellar biosynthesis protein FlhB